MRSSDQESNTQRPLQSTRFNATDDEVSAGKFQAFAKVVMAHAGRLDKCVGALRAVACFQTSECIPNVSRQRIMSIFAVKQDSVFFALLPPI